MAQRRGTGSIWKPASVFLTLMGCLQWSFDSVTHQPSPLAFIASPPHTPFQLRTRVWFCISPPSPPPHLPKSHPIGKAGKTPSGPAFSVSPSSRHPFRSVGKELLSANLEAHVCFGKRWEFSLTCTKQGWTPQAKAWRSLVPSGIHPVPLITYHTMVTPAEAASLPRPVLPAQVIFPSLQMLFCLLQTLYFLPPTLSSFEPCFPQSLSETSLCVTFSSP